MNEYERMLAYLKILYHNFEILHRHLSGCESWFGTHEQIGEWYEDAGNQVDDLAETGIALGYKEPSIADAVLAFNGDVIPVIDRGSRESLMICLEGMRSIAGLMNAARPIVPPDVQSQIDQYVYHWNKEGNYKIAAALGRGMEYDDD